MAFPVPLREGDAEPIVNLQALLAEIHHQSGYDLAIDVAIDRSKDPAPL